jgi:hypothetical protein
MSMVVKTIMVYMFDYLQVHALELIVHTPHATQL